MRAKPDFRKGWTGVPYAKVAAEKTQEPRSRWPVFTAPPSDGLPQLIEELDNGTLKKPWAANYSTDVTKAPKASRKRGKVAKDQDDDDDEEEEDVSDDEVGQGPSEPAELRGRSMGRAMSLRRSTRSTTRARNSHERSQSPAPRPKTSGRTMYIGKHPTTRRTSLQRDESQSGAGESKYNLIIIFLM